MVYSAIKYKKFDSQRRFGVELETSGSVSKTKVRSLLKSISHHNSYVTKYQLSGSGNSWHVKDDATCGPLARLGPKGVEIASFVGKGIADLQHISDVADGLALAGCEVNRNCGLHVHADAKDLTPRQVGTIVAYWLKIEPILEMALPLHRSGNEYCRSVLSRCRIGNWIKEQSGLQWDGVNMWEAVRPVNLAYYENEDRRVNLNLVNYARAMLYDTTARKTLELRWPEGTLSGRDVKCWVRWFLGFIDNCKDLPMPRNLYPVDLNTALEYMGLNHSKNTFVIFSDGLHDTRSWFLERILANNTPQDLLMRGAPVLAYPTETLKDARNLLNMMWSPVKKYA